GGRGVLLLRHGLRQREAPRGQAPDHVGGVLGRQEVPRPAHAPRRRLRHGRLRGGPPGRRRADGQALPDGRRSRLQEPRQDPAPRHHLVEGRRGGTAALRRQGGHARRRLQRPDRQPPEEGHAAGHRVEPGEAPARLLGDPEGRAEPAERAEVHRVRHAGQAAGRVQRADSLWAHERSGLRVRQAGDGQAAADLSGEPQEAVPPQRGLVRRDRPRRQEQSRADHRALEQVDGPVVTAASSRARTPRPGRGSPLRALQEAAAARWQGTVGLLVLPAVVFLLKAGLIDTPLKLLYSAVGVHVGMVHVLLPLMILPLYSVMVGIDRTLPRAAQTLGAGPLRTFLRVFLPLSLPGVRSGCVLVFLVALGFYITPAMLGGLRDSMIAMLIESQITQLVNWGFAATAAVVLLAVTLGGFSLAGRVSGMTLLVASEVAGQTVPAVTWDGIAGSRQREGRPWMPRLLHLAPVAALGR